MIITFCGHSGYSKKEEDEIEVLDLLEKQIGYESAELYLGGYGGFDNFAYSCCKKYKEKHSNVSLVFVTPYFTIEYQKKHLSALKDQYDYIIYPEIEDRPKRFAITYRNRYMIDRADIVIAYIAHDWGGAFKTYQYAKSKGKIIINLAEK